MKIIIVGGNGTIGKKVCAVLLEKHEVITAGRNNADVYVDLSDTASIKAMFESVGLIDAVVKNATVNSSFTGSARAEASMPVIIDRQSTAIRHWRNLFISLCI